LNTPQLADLEYGLPIEGGEIWFNADLSSISAERIFMIA
jgi:hypothetical protein